MPILQLNPNFFFFIVDVKVVVIIRIQPFTLHISVDISNQIVVVVSIVVFFCIWSCFFFIQILLLLLLLLWCAIVSRFKLKQIIKTKNTHNFIIFFIILLIVLQVMRNWSSSMMAQLRMIYELACVAAIVVIRECSGRLWVCNREIRRIIWILLRLLLFLMLLLIRLLLLLLADHLLDRFYFLLNIATLHAWRIQIIHWAQCNPFVTIIPWCFIVTHHLPTRIIHIPIVIESIGITLTISIHCSIHN